jgi:hypothetical protein
MQNVTLSENDAKRLRDLNDKQTGLQIAINGFVENGQRRAAELQLQGRELFTEFAKTYNLDLAHVEYVPSQDGTELVVTTVRYDRR